MSLQDYQIAIPGLTIGPGTPYILTEWSGYGVPAVRTSDDPVPQDDGSWTGPDYLDSRELTLSVVVRGDTPEDTVANAEALLAAWNLDTSQDGYGARMPLTLKMPGIDERVIFGRPRRAQLETTRIVGTNVVADLEFFCPDPLWYSSSLRTQVFSLSEPASGRGYNRSYDYGYGGATDSGIENLTNAGSRAVWPIAVIEGPVVNPRIENIDTGQTLALSYTLLAGETLELDFQAKTVLLNGTASRYYAKSGEWFKLAPGANNIRFVSGSYDAGAVLIMSWRDAWV